MSQQRRKTRIGKTQSDGESLLNLERNRNLPLTNSQMNKTIFKSDNPLAKYTRKWVRLLRRFCLTVR